MQIKDLRLRLSLKTHSGSGLGGKIGVHSPGLDFSGCQSTSDGPDWFTGYSYGTRYLISTKQILFTGVAIGDTIGCSHHPASGVELRVGKRRSRHEWKSDSASSFDRLWRIRRDFRPGPRSGRHQRGDVRRPSPGGTVPYADARQGLERERPRV